MLRHAGQRVVLRGPVVEEKEAGERRLRLARQQLAQQANQLCVALLLGGPPRHAGDLEGVRVVAQHQQLVTAAERHAGGHVKVPAHVAAGVVGPVLLLVNLQQDVAPWGRQSKARVSCAQCRIQGGQSCAQPRIDARLRCRAGGAAGVEEASMPGRFAETVGLDDSFDFFSWEESRPWRGLGRRLLCRAGGAAGVEASMPGRWRGREAPMPGRFAETLDSDPPTGPLDFFSQLSA